MAFHVGRHPWSVPWPLFDRLDSLRGAVGYRPGLTIDIHAYAYRALPPANLVSCRIQLELCRYRWEHREPGIGAELVRILHQELLPLLPAGPSPLKRDFTAYVFADLKAVVDDPALTLRAFRDLDSLEQEVVTFTEILQLEKQEGVVKGIVRGEAQGIAQGMARMLVEYVDAVWGAETGQHFRERLLALDHAAGPRCATCSPHPGRDAIRWPSKDLEWLLPRHADKGFLEILGIVKTVLRLGTRGRLSCILRHAPCSVSGRTPRCEEGA